MRKRVLKSCVVLYDYIRSEYSIHSIIYKTSTDVTLTLTYVDLVEQYGMNWYHLRYFHYMMAYVLHVLDSKGWCVKYHKDFDSKCWDIDFIELRYNVQSERHYLNDWRKTFQELTRL